MQQALQIQQVVSTSSKWIETAKDFVLLYGLKIIGAVLIYFIGSWIIKKISQGTARVLASKKYDPSLQTFLRSLISVGLTILLILVVIDKLGVNITSFAALLAGAGLAIGAALNGTLGNFAGGVMLLIFKPFKVGDIIEAQSQIGIVTELNIFDTVIISEEQKTIILPNGPLATGTIINYNTGGHFCVDIKLAIETSQNIDLAKETALTVMRTHLKVLETPAPAITISKVENGMVLMAIRPYTARAEDYWTVLFEVQELVKKAWDAAGIKEPDRV